MQLGILIAEAGISTGGARAIQLALAPVFLLTGIAGLLNVMTGRLVRIVDRGRHLWDSLGDETAKPPHKSASYLRTLERRRRFVSMGITSCTLAALLVCTVILLLFVEVLLDLQLKWLEGVVFAGATVALTGSFSGDGDVLAATTTGTSITASYNSANETLTLSGSDTLAHYQQVLDSVAFLSGTNGTNGGANASRTVTWVLNDGSAANNLSAPVQSSIGIAPASFALTISKAAAMTGSEVDRPGMSTSVMGGG